jgi:hypothetical protein
MAKFRRKAQEVEAVQWWKLGDHPDVERYDIDDPQDTTGWIDTAHDGCGVVEPGCWIVTDSKGRVTVYGPYWFAEKFEPAE